ncbi:hypothetical protein GPJ56_007224 [Histomonas meleagridis]|nr:hypothetical protein GPJ56_007224 [Histomonas meleagridis]
MNPGGSVNPGKWRLRRQETQGSKETQAGGAPRVGSDTQVEEQETQEGETTGKVEWHPGGGENQAVEPSGGAPRRGARWWHPGQEPRQVAPRAVENPGVETQAEDWQEAGSEAQAGGA